MEKSNRFEEYLRFLLNDDKNKQSAGFFYQLWIRAHVDTVTNRTMGEMYQFYTSNIEEFIGPLRAVKPSGSILNSLSYYH